MTARVRLFILGAWSGALLAFALVILSAFGALPGTDLAAGVVGGALPRIDRLGIACGLLATLLGLPSLRRANPKWGAGLRTLLPLVGAGLHTASLCWLSPAIHGLREAAGGSIQGLGAEDPTVQQFARLHLWSTTFYLGCASVAIATALWDLIIARRHPTRAV
jgi:hypothetical protein